MESLVELLAWRKYPSIFLASPNAAEACTDFHDLAAEMTQMRLHLDKEWSLEL